MRISWTLLCLLASMLIPFTATARADPTTVSALPLLGLADTAGSMVPGGSYLNSCKDIKFDPATNILDANCDVNERGMFEGYPVKAAGGFNITGCLPNSIFNDDGELYCFTEKPWGNGHVIPDGSYRATCTDSHVTNNVLIAKCAMTNGDAVAAELNLDSCRWGGDISNYHGGLRCEEAVAAAPLLIKPVAVEPGIVKPVTIAPVEPAVSGGTTTNAKERRKKRRDRGERG